jgi:hypothetical protein
MENFQKYKNCASDVAIRYGYPNVSEHIINVMASVMMHRDGIRIGGGFVKAVCENNLDECVSRADDEVINYLKLFSIVKRNGYVQD